MKDLNLEKHLDTFLKTFVPENKPFLLAVSGGIDSTALLYAVAACSKKKLAHVVHIDHGWRTNSFEEAQELGKKVALLELPFHSFRLPPAPDTENLEEWSRLARMRCFLEIGKTVGTNIVLVAHHADDQIEVVLKRMLEGSSIKNFRGMRVQEELEHITFLRPFLSFRKKTLHSFLEEKNISYFDDPTNRDPHFLRARFRTELLPFMRHSFGKDFEKSLLRVSEEALLLDEWVQESLTETFFIGQIQGMAYASLKDKKPSLFLLHHLIDTLRKKCALPAPSRSQVCEAAAHFIAEPQGGVSFPIGQGILLVEHHWVGVFARRPDPMPQFRCDQDAGATHLSGWEISWKESLFQEPVTPTWTELFQGKVARIYIPKQPFVISRSSDRFLKTRKRKDVAPTSFRPFVPAIIQENKLVADFLTGYSIPMQTDSVCYEVSIKQKLQ